MTLLRSTVAIRAVAALFGLALLVPLFLLQLFPGHMGWSAGIVLGLVLVGGPCGALLYFARTGGFTWGAVFFLPPLALLQSASVLVAVAEFPHSPTVHLAAPVAVSWLGVLAAHRLSTRRSG